MLAVPRVRDTLQVVPVPGTPGQHVVCDRHGRELFHLTADGVWILSQLDGLTSADEILLRFEERFDREMDKEDLAAFLDGLADAPNDLVDTLTHHFDQVLERGGGTP